MTYETALTLFYLLTIPAAALLVYKLHSQTKRKEEDMKDNPFAYEMDKKSGEIIFSDENLAQHMTDPGVDSHISMIDVLAPDEEELAVLNGDVQQDKVLEEAET